MVTRFKEGFACEIPSCGKTFTPETKESSVAAKRHQASPAEHIVVVPAADLQGADVLSLSWGGPALVASGIPIDDADRIREQEIARMDHVIRGNYNG